jgi:glycosyltransferase involved in cell wall biosynthesis
MVLNPTVTVIIPTYDRAHLIGRAIQSILNQTYGDFELIVVDDGSSDNTAEIIHDFNDKRIKYIRHEKNKGAAAARNTGIESARGTYIAFQDSDDEWFPHKLEKQVEAFSDAPPKVGIVYSGVWRLEGGKKTYIAYPDKNKKEGDLHINLLRISLIFLQSALVKMECFSKVGMFDKELPAAEDWELWIRISKYFHFKFIDEPLALLHHTPGSLSTRPDAFVRALQMILTKHHDDFKKARGLLSDYSLVVGSYLCTNGEFTRGKDYLVQSVRANPLNIFALINTLVSFLGEDAYCKIAAFYMKIRNLRLSKNL